MTHLPDGDLEDGLQHYQPVTYDNIDQGKIYFITMAHDDYLGKIVLKDDYVINIDFIMKHYHIDDGWRYHNGKIAAEKDQVVNGEIQFYDYIDYDSANSGMNMSGGSVSTDIEQRLNTPSYILPAGTVVRRIAPAPVAMRTRRVARRTTPPFFRKSRRDRRRSNNKRKTRKTRKTRRNRRI